MLELATARAASEEFDSCWSPFGTHDMQADSFGWGALWAAIGAMVTGFLAWVTQRSKGDTDRDIAVIAQWKELTAALASRVSVVETELATVKANHSAELEAIHRAHRAELEAIDRAHRAELDEMRRTHRAEKQAMRETNEGLMRMIAQGSQSAAVLLGESPVTGSLKRSFAPDEDGGK